MARITESLHFSLPAVIGLVAVPSPSQQSKKPVYRSSYSSQLFLGVLLYFFRTSPTTSCTFVSSFIRAAESFSLIICFVLGCICTSLRHRRAVLVAAPRFFMGSSALRVPPPYRVSSCTVSCFRLVLHRLVRARTNVLVI